MLKYHSTTIVYIYRINIVFPMSAMIQYQMFFTFFFFSKSIGVNSIPTNPESINKFRPSRFLLSLSVQTYVLIYFFSFVRIWLYVVVQPIMRIKYVCLTRRAFVLFNCRSNNQQKNKINAPHGKNFPQIMLEEFWAALIPWHLEHTKVSTDDIYV